MCVPYVSMCVKCGTCVLYVCYVWRVCYMCAICGSELLYLLVFIHVCSLCVCSACDMCVVRVPVIYVYARRACFLHMLYL